MWILRKRRTRISIEDSPTNDLSDRTIRYAARHFVLKKTELHWFPAFSRDKAGTSHIGARHAAGTGSQLGHSR